MNTPTGLDDGLDAVRVFLGPDGADVTTIGWDEGNGRLALRLELEGAECPECVIPQPMLGELMLQRDPGARARGAWPSTSTTRATPSSARDRHSSDTFRRQGRARHRRGVGHRRRQRAASRVAGRARGRDRPQRGRRRGPSPTRSTAPRRCSTCRTPRRGIHLITDVTARVRRHRLRPPQRGHRHHPASVRHHRRRRSRSIAGSWA